MSARSTELPLDLAELAKAMDAIGCSTETVGPFMNDRPRLTWGHPGQTVSPQTWSRKWWDGEAESPWLTVCLRDAVRQAAPGSYCIPMMDEGYPPLVVVILDSSRLPIETDPLPSPYYGRGQNETECWARALVALYRAGTLPVAEVV